MKCEIFMVIQIIIIYITFPCFFIVMSICVAIEPHLIMILHQLNNNTNIITIIFYRNDAHNISCILSIRILTVFIGKNQACISFMNLFDKSDRIETKYIEELIYMWKDIHPHVKNCLKFYFEIMRIFWIL